MSSAARGHDYEKNAVKHLKQFKLVPPGFTPAGAENRPDIYLKTKAGTAGCELKVSTKVGGGSVNFIHDKGKWKFETSTKLPEQQFMIKIAKKAGFFEMLNERWVDIPMKRTPITKEVAAMQGSMTKEQMYRIDLKNFKSFSFPVDPRVLEKYYVEKDAAYINIGTHGFYLLGPSDPLGLNKNLSSNRMKKIPRFADVANMTMMVQVKNKGAGKWHQYMIEGRFTIPVANKSPYNIAATDGNGANIIMSQTNLSCLL